MERTRFQTSGTELGERQHCTPNQYPDRVTKTSGDSMPMSPASVKREPRVERNTSETTCSKLGTFEAYGGRSYSTVFASVEFSDQPN
uniref:Uncharacterized protein n=1 Tax=Caenorhabditis japonica TaxID=281687 RepID=A0A8R1IR22_CAEJA